MFIEIEVDWHGAVVPEQYTPDPRVICININAIEEFYYHKTKDGRHYTLVASRRSEDSFWYSTETYDSIREKITQVRDKFRLTGPL